MKIKVGEYVRTNDGYIRKVTEVETEDTIPIVVDKPVLDDDTKWRNCYIVMECVDVERIKKHSFNIIDLIEEGDYVNGYKIMRFEDEGTIYDDKADDFVDIKGTFIVLGNEEGQYSIQPKDIKSIVTKEQFEEMEYKI